jgi:hypothetical protein
MLLVQRFHLNFILVKDRWEGQGSVEALKERFYEIQRKLHEFRELPPLPDDNPLLSKPFNRQWEEERKAQLEAAALRSKEQDQGDAEILERAKKIEAALKRKRIAEKSASRSRDKVRQLPRCAPSVSFLPHEYACLGTSRRLRSRVTGVVLPRKPEQRPSVAVSAIAAQTGRGARFCCPTSFWLKTPRV